MPVGEASLPAAGSSLRASWAKAAASPAEDMAARIWVARRVGRAASQTASSSYKPAKADNGVRIMIPPYMGPGERIVVDTATGEYVRRAE